MRILVFFFLHVPYFALAADPSISIRWSDTTEAVYENQTAEIENCGRGEMTFVVGSEIAHNHSIEISNRIKGNAGVSVPFYGATVEVGAEIEKSFTENFSSSRSEVQEVTVTIPEFSDRHRLKVTVEETWQNGRMEIIERQLIGRDRIETYPVKRVRSRRIIDVKKNSPSCLGDEWATEIRQVRLTDFRRVGGGDCEMDTSHNLITHVTQQA